MARWLVDFDSTLANFEEAMLGALNREFGTNYPIGSNTTWNWWYTDIPKEQSEFIWGPEGFQNRELTMAMPPLDGAVEKVRNLLSNGHVVVVVSDRDTHMEEWLETWLRNHGLNVPVLINDKKKRPKAEVAKTLDLSYVIEDAPHNVLAMADDPYFEKIFMIDTPYNRHIDHWRVTRIYGWHQVDP